MESPRRKKIDVRLSTLGCVLLALGLTSNTAYAERTRAHLLPAAFQQGDLILRRGKGFISDIARNFSTIEKRFSHVGIIVDYRHRAHVVHSVHEDAKGFNGVVIEPLSEFLNDATDWAVYRLKLDKTAQHKLASTAVHYAHSNIPFDPHFDLGSRQALYCTEFIWRVSGEVASPNPILAATIRAGTRYISIEDIYKQDNAMLIERMQTGRNR